MLACSRRSDCRASETVFLRDRVVGATPCKLAPNKFEVRAVVTDPRPRKNCMTAASPTSFLFCFSYQIMRIKRSNEQVRLGQWYPCILKLHQTAYLYKAGTAVKKETVNGSRCSFWTFYGACCLQGSNTTGRGEKHEHFNVAMRKWEMLAATKVKTSGSKKKNAQEHMQYFLSCSSIKSVTRNFKVSRYSRSTAKKCTKNLPHVQRPIHFFAVFVAVAASTILYFVWVNYI